MLERSVSEATVSDAAVPAPLLQVQDLTLEFATPEGTVRAVDGLSFEVTRGMTLGIVGESGCGKSVTARAILRIEDASSRIVRGRIVLHRSDGEVDLVAHPRSSRTLREIRGGTIGLIFQEPMTSFSPVHTIGNQIIEPIRLHLGLGSRAARELAATQLRSVGIPNPDRALDQYAWQLSGGQRQRAMIAMALVCNPKLLVADEPTTALDVTTQAQVLELLRDLQRQRRMGLILITHDLGVVAETVDHVVVMYLGTAVESGPVHEVFSDPLHPYTRGLLRSIPSVTAMPRTRLPALPGSVPHPRNRPAGCPFHTRCSLAIAGTCDRVIPVPKLVTPGHAVACHLHGYSPES
jgi:oligopeptide/dipeptide ABC transporter ATP-binding protein